MVTLPRRRPRVDGGGGRLLAAYSVARCPMTDHEESKVSHGSRSDGSVLLYSVQDAAAPPRPRPSARLFARIANGKSQLCVRFATGPIQVPATEP